MLVGHGVNKLIGFFDIIQCCDKRMEPLIDYTCDKQVLWVSAGAFFSARQLSFQPASRAQFRRSCSSSKMFCFSTQSVRVRTRAYTLIFLQLSKQKVFTLFGTMRLPPPFGFVRLFSKIF